MWKELLTNESMLRPGQLGALFALRGHFLGAGRGHIAQIQLPTGYGKTLVMLLASQLLNRGRQTLVVCGSEVLREQLARCFAGYFDTGEEGRLIPYTSTCAREILKPALGVGPKQRVSTKVGVGQTSDAAIPSGVEVVVGHPNSLQSYAPKNYQEPVQESDKGAPLIGLILIDEGHHLSATTWLKIVANNPEAKVVLFTATPFRGDARGIPGKLVFSYSLAEAICEKSVSDASIKVLEEGTEKKNQTTPVETADELIADTAIEQLENLVTTFPQAKILAKCRDVDQAVEVAALYVLKAGTVYQGKDVLLLHSKLTTTNLKLALQCLESGNYRIVVAVDMLAEGIDIPFLRVLAVHTRLPDLGHFVQIAGRVSRTLVQDGEDVDSHLIILKSALPKHLQDKPPKSLQDLAEKLQQKIEHEELKSEFIDYLHDGEIPEAALSELLDAVLLREHAKVFACTAGAKTDWDKVDNIGNANIVGYRTYIAFGGRIQVAFLAIQQKATWLNQLAVPTLIPGLILTYEPKVEKRKTRLLFVTASPEAKRYVRLLIDNLDEDAEQFRPLSLNRLKSVFSGRPGVNYYNVGLRSRLPSPLIERYRIASGPDVEKTLDASASFGFSQGHVMGRLYDYSKESGLPNLLNQELLGVSSNGAVWGVKSIAINDLARWMNNTAVKINGSAEVTNSALESIPIPTELNFAKLPKGEGVGAFWGAKTWTDSVRLIVGSTSITLSDFTIYEIESDPLKEQISFKVGAQGEIVQGSFPIISVLVKNYGVHFECDPNVMIEASSETMTLDRWLAKDPPLIFLEDGTCVFGQQVVSLSNGGSDLSYLQDFLFSTDWSNCDVGMEKPPGFEPEKTKRAPGAAPQLKAVNYDIGNAPSQDRSIFRLVATQLIARVKSGILKVALCDDDAGELADFIAARELSNGLVIIELYLCKAAGSDSPGFRTKDVEELWAQALRTSQLLTKTDVLKHIGRRHMSRIKMADDIPTAKKSLFELVEKAKTIEFEIILVQPGLAIDRLNSTTVGALGPKTTIPFAFAWLHSTFQQRGVRLILVGRETVPRKPGKVVKSATFNDIFARHQPSAVPAAASVSASS